MFNVTSLSCSARRTLNFEFCQVVDADAPRLLSAQGAALKDYAIPQVYVRTVNVERDLMPLHRKRLEDEPKLSRYGVHKRE